MYVWPPRDERGPEGGEESEQGGYAPLWYKNEEKEVEDGALRIAPMDFDARFVLDDQNYAQFDMLSTCTEICKKAWLFAKLQPSRARKRINAT